MPVDSSVAECQVCSVKFTLITRRHWCRACLKTICAKCSSAFSESASLLSKLSRRHENNLCIKCTQAAKNAIEERMLKEAFRRHTERSSSATGAQRRGRQLFQDGEGAVDGPRRVASADPKQRSSRASGSRNSMNTPKSNNRRSVCISPAAQFGFDDETPQNTRTPQRIASASAKRRISFAENLAASVVEAEEFSPNSAKKGNLFPSDDSETVADQNSSVTTTPRTPCDSSARLSGLPGDEQQPNSARSNGGGDENPENYTMTIIDDQENSSPKKFRRMSSSTGLPAHNGVVKPILKSRSANKVVRNF